MRRDIKYLIEFFKQTHLDLVLGILFFTVFSGTVLFYMVEHGTNPGVHTIWDAFWYTTTTTISGNSDINPDTFYGEIMTIPMMLFGIIFIGLFAASITSYLMKKSDKKHDAKEESELQELKRIIIDMQSDIRELNDFIKKSK